MVVQTDEFVTWCSYGVIHKICDSPSPMTVCDGLSYLSFKKYMLYCVVLSHMTKIIVILLPPYVTRICDLWSNTPYPSPIISQNSLGHCNESKRFTSCCSLHLTLCSLFTQYQVLPPENSTTDPAWTENWASRVEPHPPK